VASNSATEMGLVQALAVAKTDHHKNLAKKDSNKPRNLQINTFS
jgi:hypothetical protein